MQFSSQEHWKTGNDNVRYIKSAEEAAQHATFPVATRGLKKTEIRREDDRKKQFLSLCFGCF